MARRQGLRLRHLESGTHKAEYCGRLMEGKTLTLFILSPPTIPITATAPNPLLLPPPIPHPSPPCLKRPRTALMLLTIYVDG